MSVWNGQLACKRLSSFVPCSNLSAIWNRCSLRSGTVKPDGWECVLKPRLSTLSGRSRALFGPTRGSPSRCLRVLRSRADQIRIRLPRTAHLKKGSPLLEASSPIKKGGAERVAALTMAKQSLSKSPIKSHEFWTQIPRVAAKIDGKPIPAVRTI